MACLHRFWTERSRTQLLQARTKDSLSSITAALSNTQRELANLARTNVYNDAFCIGHDGVFGTINGLRLGRVPGINVEWAEINAACGQALLLLYTIARKVDFTFESYVHCSSSPYDHSLTWSTKVSPHSHGLLLKDRANTRRQRHVRTVSVIQLFGATDDGWGLNSAFLSHHSYGSGDINITRVLHNRRFDYAMVAFLECLRQLMEHVRARDPSVDFPHTWVSISLLQRRCEGLNESRCRVVKDKIGDVSIKLQFSQEEIWTKAMRHVLLALKILLRWATSG